jgi:hypothetical protein
VERLGKEDLKNGVPGMGRCVRHRLGGLVVGSSLRYKGIYWAPQACQPTRSPSFPPFPLFESIIATTCIIVFNCHSPPRTWTGLPPQEVSWPSSWVLSACLLLALLTPLMPRLAASNPDLAALNLDLAALSPDLASLATSNLRLAVSSPGLAPSTAESALSTQVLAQSPSAQPSLVRYLYRQTRERSWNLPRV